MDVSEGRERQDVNSDEPQRWIWGSGTQQAVHMPTPEEIEERCAEFRQRHLAAMRDQVHMRVAEGSAGIRRVDDSQRHNGNARFL